MHLLHTSSRILHKYNSITLQLSDGERLGSTTIFISVSFGTKSGHVYSGFEFTCPDCDLQSALDHAARDKKRHSSS